MPVLPPYDPLNPASCAQIDRECGSKKAAPSNKMFDQMLSDYRAALQSARDTLNS